MEIVKKCTKCGIEKSLDLYHRKCKGKFGVNAWCKACHVIYSRPYIVKYNKSGKRPKRSQWSQFTEEDKKIINKKRRDKYHSDLAYQEKCKARDKVWYWTNIKSRMFTQVKTRCKQRGIYFNITHDDIVIPEYCPILAVKFDKSRYSYSLDRIDPTKGYISGNVRVISMKANTMKNDASLQELSMFAKNILKYMNNDIVQTVGKPIELENKESLG